MTAIIRQFDSLRASGMLGQLVRFGISGVISTLIYLAVFLPLTHWVFLGAKAVYAVPPAFAVAVTAGYFHPPNWAPLIPVVLVTPIATFALNRQWVFG